MALTAPRDSEPSDHTAKVLDFEAARRKRGLPEKIDSAAESTIAILVDEDEAAAIVDLLAEKNGRAVSDLLGQWLPHPGPFHDDEAEDGW